MFHTNAFGVGTMQFIPDGLTPKFQIQPVNLGVLLFS